MQRSLAVLAGAALCASVAVPADAQDVATLRTVRFGVQGGLAFPMGEDGDALNTGFTIGGTLDWRLVNRPFGLRLDVGYQRFGLDEEIEELFEEFGVEADPISLISGTGAIVISIPTAGAIRPYVLGGPGVYHLRQTIRIPDEFGDCGFDDGAVESRRPSASRVAASRGATAGQAAQISCSFDSTDFGLHAGGGLGFPLGAIDAYVEVRYHSIFTEESNTSYVPLVFGLRF